MLSARCDENKEVKSERKHNPLATVYYPVDESDTSITLAIENCKFTHGSFLVMTKSLDSSPDLGGLCNGYVGAFADFGVKGKFEQFRNLISDICQLSYTDLAANSDFKTFMRRMCYYQEPEHYGIKSSRLDLAKISKIINLKEEFQNQYSNLENVYADELILSEKEWLQYLELLSNLLVLLQSRDFSLIMIFNVYCIKKITDSVRYNENTDIICHRIVNYFDSEKKEWHNININSLPVIDLALGKRESPVVTTVKILKHYCEHSYISASVRILTCQENPELKNIKGSFINAKHKLKKLVDLQKTRITHLGDTILDLAVGENNLDNVNLYREAGIGFSFNPIIRATRNRSIEVLEHLVATEPKLLESDSKSLATPAIYAAQDNIPEAIEILSKAKVNLNYTNRSEGYAPIHFAAQNNCIEVMHILLKNRIDINMRNKRGDTAACIAATKDNAEILSMLAEMKADLELPREDGYRPIHMAAQQGSVRSIKILSEYKINMSHRIPDGRSALCIALQRQHFKAAKQILFNLSFDDINLQDRTMISIYKKEILQELDHEHQTFKIEKIKSFVKNSYSTFWGTKKRIFYTSSR